MAVRHNAKHQFKLGYNNSSELNLAVPFPTPGQQGWKWIYETFATGHLYTADSNPYELTVEGVTPAPVPAANGILVPSLAGDNTSTLVQWTTPVLQLGAATKKFYLETSVTVTATDMAENEIFIGFTSDIQGTGFVLANGTAWAFNDGFGFGKLDAATEIDFISRDGDVEQTIGLGETFTTATRITLACYFDGDKFNIFRDNKFLTNTDMQVLDTGGPIGISAYAKSGEGSLSSLLVNYVALGTEL